MDHIGARIRYWRRRRKGMSQAALAGLSGVSQAYISKIEAGLKPLDRRPTQIAIAGALQITVAQLLGQPGDPTDPAKADAVAVVPEIRATLVELDAGEVPPVRRGREELAALATRAHELRLSFDSSPP